MKHSWDDIEKNEKKLDLFPGIIIPLIGISIAALMGMRGEDIALLIAAFAAPTAVSSYPMALQMDSDGPLTAQIVAVTTALCIVTVFLWVFVLKQFGII